MYFVENSGVLRAIRALLKPREIFTTVERPPLAENFETYSKGKQRDSGVKQFHEMTVYSIPCLAGHESKLILPSYWKNTLPGNILDIIFRMHLSFFVLSRLVERKNSLIRWKLRTKFKLGRFSKNPIVGYFLKIIKFARKILLYAFR